LSELTI